MIGKELQKLDKLINYRKNFDALKNINFPKLDMEHHIYLLEN